MLAVASIFLQIVQIIFCEIVHSCLEQCFFTEVHIRHSLCYFMAQTILLAFVFHRAKKKFPQRMRSIHIHCPGLRLTRFLCAETGMYFNTIFSCACAEYIVDNLPRIHCARTNTTSSLCDSKQHKGHLRSRHQARL